MSVYASSTCVVCVFVWGNAADPLPSFPHWGPEWPLVKPLQWGRVLGGLCVLRLTKSPTSSSPAGAQAPLPLSLSLPVHSSGTGEAEPV